MAKVSIKSFRNRKVCTPKNTGQWQNVFVRQTSQNVRRWRSHFRREFVNLLVGKFLTKEMFMGCWAKPKGLTQTLIYKKRRLIKSLLKKLFYIKVFHYKVRKLFCCHRRSSVIWKGKCNGSGYVFF